MTKLERCSQCGRKKGHFGLLHGSKEWSWLPTWLRTWFMNLHSFVEG